MAALIKKKQITLRLPPPHKGGQETFLYWSTENPLAQALIAPCGTKCGKAESLQTLIPTPSGWKMLGDIHEGDYVFDEHGKPVMVIYETDPMYDHNCYELVFSEGTKVVADEEHLWVTECFDGGSAVRTTKEILDTLYKYGETSSHRIRAVDNDIPEIGFKKPANQWVYILSITQVESVPVKCIKVDSPTHLFLCGEGCIPTHNTYGSSLWMVTEAMTFSRLYCVWIAPTYLKCKIAYRYFKSFMPADSSIDMMDGLLEIRLGNGSFVKFLHGKDAETTIEGEAVDRFVVDEAGKISKQVWISLMTTITQTRGKGIITGTPRGLTWYYELSKQAQLGDDPFFVYVNLKTEDSPFVSKEAISRAKKLLPAHLFSQYYLAEFVSHSTTFGDLNTMWDDSIAYKTTMERFWVHDEHHRIGDVFHGVDVARKQDYTVFYSVNSGGKLVGYCRFQHIPYPQQIIRLKTYITNYFTGCENTVRFDATGVGVAFEDMLAEAQFEADLQPISFTTKSKSEMITKAVLSVQSGWHKTPKIRRISHEFGIYELSVTATGLHKYGAPDGEHDDVVSAAILAISGAYSNSCSTVSEEYMLAALSGESLDDVIGAYADMAMEGPDPFDTEDIEDDHDFQFDYEDA